MRPSSVLHLALALAALASVSACNCQRRAAVDTPIAELQPCNEDERCETGLCDSANGNPKACLRPCTQTCRASDLCTQLSDGRYACVPERAGLCKSCESDSDCPQVADRCLVANDGTHYCGRDCTFDGTCPPTFRCGEATTVSGARVPRQCQPVSADCDCIAATSGQQLPCAVSTDAGSCVGVSTCRPPVGYDVCSARTPTAERCNGIDDDCNGQTDENLGDLSCGVGECVRAVSVCANGVAQPCAPGLPASETCNGLDDNCNGVTDDGFDLSTNVAHCGACNRACVLTHAFPKCEAGACAVDHCVAGWTDLDRVASNGCEYPCVPTDGGVEICDGLDNDCDGLVDENTNLASDPTNCGQCNLVCSVAGTSVATYACNARTCAIGTCTLGRGNCNQQYGDGCEVDLTTDVSHCGTCTQACAIANGTPACVSGQCRVGACNPGFADCNGLVADGCETNTQTTLTHCGTCATQCNAANASNSCVAGACRYTCASNWWDADGLSTNGCEYACVRSAGGVEVCDGLDNDCDNRIDEDFDLTSNPLHCGQCNRACTATSATTACVASSCTITSCTLNRANCNGLYADGCEVNTGADLGHCGACNALCSTANATPRCLGGVCGVLSCNAGYSNCNNLPGDGCEVNTGGSDVNNCGACNFACFAANGTPKCTSGACGVLSCNTGFANCNNLPADGCEVNTNTNLTNCGGCGTTCSFPHAAPSCAGGTCGIQSCVAGWSNCNGLRPDGCEVNTGGSDITNCGGCGTTCTTANGTPACNAGVCGTGSCNTGFANCNGLPSDGCEANLNTNLNDCGGCGAVCSPAHATGACVAGACGLGACLPGFVNLNGVVGDGCEYACAITNSGLEACDGRDNNCNGLVDEPFNLSSDLSNCGACGNVCNAPHVAVPACSSGACVVQTCAAGFTNCDGQFTNGCEENTSTSLTSCGSCGAVCTRPNATPVCVAGSCQVGGCLGAFRNCNGLSPDGCEVNTGSDPSSCGACGTNCPTPANSARTCSASTCGYTCNAGYADVDLSPVNGCESSCSSSGVDDPDDGSADQNCDGIDGTVSKALFVALGGNDLNPGTRALPKATVQAAINAASTLQPHVYVSEGLYDEAIALRSGVSVFGGYSQANNWARGPAYLVTLRNGVVSNGRIVAVSGTGLTVPTTVAYVTIQALDAVAAGASVYGLYCNDCTALTLRTTLVISGVAGNGAAGTAGVAGAIGSPGTGGADGTCNNNIAGAAGGPGGVSSCGRPGGDGGKGGNYGSNAGLAGSTGVVGVPGGGGGAGGDPGRAGTGGANGPAGLTGASGVGGSAGGVAGGFFVAGNGGSGSTGDHGNGGGGGGGGGGQGCTFCNDGNGNGGGGGGGGGCAGGVATGGLAGGSSFGVFLVDSTGAVVLDSTIASSVAGGGGAGGSGGAGGTGGAAGIGATYCTGEIGAGANGGTGGSGGRGGHGGGGAGGSSFGLYRFNSAVSPVNTTAVGGSPGFGGPSSGNVGANGTSGGLF